MKTSNHKQVQIAFEKGGLQSVFKDVLGWDTKSDEFEDFRYNADIARGKKLASLLNGAAIFEFDFSSADLISPSFQRNISKAVGQRYPERILLFKASQTTTWMWPKKTASGAATHEKLVVANGTLPLFLAQRLSGLLFDAKDMISGININQLRKRLQGAFETSSVTKKFYESFRRQQQALANAIVGLDKEDSHSYAVLLLNRLMFIYFLQKKEFLNADADYLKNCLGKLKALDVNDGFYSFYKDLLLELFFHGLNSQERNFKDAHIARILGDVPYINGGIFGASDLEKSNEISISDSVFVDIFEFFDSFAWHLDTRPSGNPNEINPEVIGYIFEQYINFNASGKKENGAYYTKHDVTGYMVSQTLIPKLLDELVTIGLKPTMLLVGSGTRYIQAPLLHGFDSEAGAWHQAPPKLEALWKQDPSLWNELDKALPDSDICLTGESWVEMFHRRERVESLKVLLESGSLGEIDDLVTNNLNSQLLLEDCILTLDNDSDLQKFWTALTGLSVLDPTCGSGAFLFAALEILEDVYARSLEAAEELPENSIFAKSILEDASSHPNRRYYIRKKAALVNLFGTDLMPDAIETAKLRVFLSLASCLDEVADIEPLPDLDFNLKSGNLIVGILDPADAERLSDRDVFATQAIQNLAPRITDFVSRYANFVSSSFDKTVNLEQSKIKLQELTNSLRSECNLVMGQMLLLTESETESWVQKNRPLHWFVEFPQVIARGGFDVIVGNPPYVRLAANDHKAMLKVGTRGYEVANARDLYAYCYERALHLLHKEGRHAFIVPINLGFSDDFAPLRGLLFRRTSRQWWSTYDQLPQGLFEGAAVRNTIHIGSNSGEKRAFSSHHQVFTVATRTWLFESLVYSETAASGSMAPGRGGVCNTLINRIRAVQGSLGKTSTGLLTLKSTANYWVPVHPMRPPVLDLDLRVTQIHDKKVKELEISESESERTLLALLSGKVGFIWWQAMGDGFDTIESTFTQLRVAFKEISGEETQAAENAVLNAGLDNTVVNMYRDLNYVSIRWAGIREVSDQFDYLALNAAGFGDEWKNLNILYRQIMRANDSRQMNQDLKENRKLWIGL